MARKRNRKAQDEPQDAQGELTPEELAREEGADLPEREEMSLVNANLAAPINAAVGLNVLSDSSTANASATQVAPITQSNG